jgi:hypothetical protein
MLLIRQLKIARLSTQEVWNERCISVLLIAVVTDGLKTMDFDGSV